MGIWVCMVSYMYVQHTPARLQDNDSHRSIGAAGYIKHAASERQDPDVTSYVHLRPIRCHEDHRSPPNPQTF